MDLVQKKKKHGAGRNRNERKDGCFASSAPAGLREAGAVWPIFTRPEFAFIPHSEIGRGARPPRAQFCAPSRKTRTSRNVSSVRDRAARVMLAARRGQPHPGRACSPTAEYAFMSSWTGSRGRCSKQINACGLTARNKDESPRAAGSSMLPAATPAVFMIVVRMVVGMVVRMTVGVVVIAAMVMLVTSSVIRWNRCVPALPAGQQHKKQPRQ
jgi:hypothetical protein